MTQRIQIVPKEGFRLFGALVKKEIDLSHANRGTFRRAGRRVRDRAKWVHSTYKGWIKLERAGGEVVVVEIRSRQQADGEWQLLHAFTGFIARHFAGSIQAIHIHFPEAE
jgi:hypothetical protein